MNDYNEDNASNTSGDLIIDENNHFNDHQLIDEDIHTIDANKDNKQLMITSDGDVNTDHKTDVKTDLKSDQTLDELVEEMQQMIDNCLSYLCESQEFESSVISQLDQLMETAIQLKTQCGSDAKDICHRFQHFLDPNK